MLFCPFAREVWERVKSAHPVELNRREFANPKQWLFDFLRRSSDHQATTLAVTFWHLWDTRNKIREEGGTAHPSSVAVKINSYVDLIFVHLYKNASRPRSETTPASPWAPPPVGSLLVNVDATLFASSTSMGAGMVVRDSLGVFVAARRDSFLNVQVPEIAEATAVRAALSFAHEEHLDNLIVATDCLTVVKRVESKLKDRSSCGPIIEDIKNLMESFSSCSITHVSRCQNVAAHCLARSAECLPSSVWRGVPPECIRETICIESLVD
jgi:ribonuclease HI